MAKKASTPGNEIAKTEGLTSQVKDRIVIIRNQPVIIDRDVAEIYGVTHEK